MTAIVQTNIAAKSGPVNPTFTTMTASDTLTYTKGSNQRLVLFNTTASPVAITLTGASATSFSPDGYGGTISVAAGKSVTVPANGVTFINLDDIYQFLVGNVTVTNGTGLKAALYVFN